MSLNMDRRIVSNSITTDILIVGAGPAGCAAAITLAQAGRDVLLVDQHPFPRDKTCGDGLIPDALKALEHLGLTEDIKRLAMPVKGLVCHGPAGGSLTVPSEMAVLPRRVLDQLLIERARTLGARVLTRAKYVTPMINETGLPDYGGESLIGRMNGANVSVDGQLRQVRARWTILATGANPAALHAAGLCTRSLPSAMAVRAYVSNPAFKGLDGHPIEHLHISWHKSYSPGYGWVFPCPNGVFNLGVGLYGLHEPGWRDRLRRLAGLSAIHHKKANLNELFRRFTEIDPLAKRLIETGTLIGGIKGAPLRCSLAGATPAVPGLLVTGEAVGSTYALTGEGIGKAMETGMLSAQALLDHETDDDICTAYADMLSNLQPKFDVYLRANKINQVPWLIDLAIARGNRSPDLVRRMSEVLEEKANPARLFTLRGAWKFLTQ